MYAVVETGGKQYKVREGDTLTLEKLEADAGSSYAFDRVLALSDEEATVFGSPYIEGASVTATVVGDGKAKKIVVYKFKSKKGYHRKIGHRQPYTRVIVDAIKKA
ncbi:MAG: 50S ribosomal protein L21 [Defluviitaleaceae bacterium]|nr:50S ribosomal protein L21 [Defluviitaleaceae bacterium]